MNIHFMIIKRSEKEWVLKERCDCNNYYCNKKAEGTTCGKMRECGIYETESEAVSEMKKLAELN